jgi:urease accessory protein
MAWRASLTLDYTLEAKRSVLRFAHDGPLRVLKSLYPEGGSICHNVLVHPPGGLVGGDTLDVFATLGSGAHALVTTPGATRFYRSEGELASQRTQLHLADGARMEWLPLESILYNGCLSENHLRFSLAPSAELLGWDITALGLPHADQAFARGRHCQHIEMPGVWLERGLLDATDARLMLSPLGLAGQRCMASLFFACGSAIGRHRREQALDCAHQLVEGHPLKSMVGITSPNPQVLVLRVLSSQVEPAMALLKSVWGAWRRNLWGVSAVLPRVWSM